MKKTLLIACAFAFALSAATASAQDYTFNSDLTVGSNGQDVSQLQTWLIANGFDIPAVSSGHTSKGHFGTQTRDAVAAYQRSIGLPAYGFFGHMTREYFNRGNHGSNQHNPSVTITNAPQTLAVGQIGTWSLVATDPQNSNLSYSVTWGDEAMIVSGNSASASAQPTFVQASSFTHAYSFAGTYTVVFTVRDAQGYMTTKQATVRVGSGTVSSITVTSPLANASWQQETYQNIQWTAIPNSGSVDVSLVAYAGNIPCDAAPYSAGSCPSGNTVYKIASKVSAAQGSYSWLVGHVYVSPMSEIPDYYRIPTGVYVVKVCASGTNVCSSSAPSLNIYSATQTGQSPTVSGLDAPVSLGVNQAGTWTIHASDPSNSALSYFIDWGDNGNGACPAGYACTPSMAVNQAFSQTSTFTHSYSTMGTYTVRATVRNSAGLTAQTSATVNVYGIFVGDGPKVTITSPNGGQVWRLGTQQTIQWIGSFGNQNSTGNGYYDLYAVMNVGACTAGQYCPSMGAVLTRFPIASSIYGNSYNWTVGNTASGYSSLQPGNYTMQVCAISSSTCVSGNSYFTVTN